MVEKEDDIRKYINDPHYLSVDKAFTKMTLFHELCTITVTNKDKADEQSVQLAYLIFNQTGAFVDSLKE